MTRLFLFLAFLLHPLIAQASADLELRQITPGIEQDILHASISISNHGPAAAEKLKCRLTLYSGEQIVDTIIIALNPIAAEETRKEDLQWKITAPAANVLVAELFDEIESDDHPANNSSKLTLRFPGYSKADLQLVDVGLPTTDKLEGRLAEFNVTIRNNGPEDVRSSVLKISLTQFQKQIAYMERRLGRLDPSDEKQIKMVLRLPGENIPVEQALLEVRFEMNDTTVDESDLTNNVFTKPILISIRMPDLTPRSVNINSRGVLSFSIANIGSAVARPTITALYRNGSLVRRYNTPELPAGKERQHLYGGTKVEPGDQIAIVADYNADLEESSEENNRLNYTASQR
jgi:CARDB protein